jgi:hypothetical protein
MFCLIRAALDLLKTEKGLDPLRTRADFRRILAGLEAQAPARTKEYAEPP